MLQIGNVGPRYGCASKATRRSRTVFALALVAIIALFGGAQNATAQGVGDALPKPMATGELVRYMQQLNLSPQQQLAVTNMHDDYKRAYANLYESTIEPFLDEMRGLGGMSMPQRDEMEKIIRGLRTLEGRIRALDNGLFDQMQAMLTEDQLVNMPRVRLARLRACYNQQQLLQMWTMGAPIIDVSATVQDLKLPAKDMDLLDPTLARYESNITGRMGRLHDGATTLWTDIYDAIENAGFNADMFENMEEADPAELQKFFTFMQEIFMELTAKGREEVSRIRDTNRTTVNSFRGVVSDDTYRTIRNAYYGRAYPNVPAITLGTPVGISVLDEIKDLSLDKRAAAQDAIVRALSEIDKIIENTADMADKFRDSFNFADFDAEKYQKHTDSLNELQKQATEVTARLNAQLQEILSADQLGQLQQRVAADSKRTSPTMMSMVAAEEAVAEVVAEDIDAAEADIQYGPDSFLPSRISQRDLTIYLALMNLSDDQQTIIKELYNTYSESYDELEQGPVKEVNDLRTEMWRYDEHGERATTVAQIDDIYAKRRSVMENIAATDRAFFDDMQLLIADEAVLKRLQRVRELRERQCYNRPSATMRNFGYGADDSESRLDVVEFLARQNLTSDALESIEPLLAQYEQQALPLMKKRYENGMDLQRIQEVWGLRWQEIQSEDGAAAANATLMKQYRDSIGTGQKNLSTVDEEIGKLNGNIFKQIIAQLPSDKAFEVRTAYQRLAFPSVYSESTSLRKHLDKSIDLNDLTAEQRTQLLDLRADYQPTYDEVCERMLTLMRESPVRNMTMEEDDWAKFSEYHDKMQRLQFERDEINSRALLRMRAVLSESQIEAIGGLPEVAKRSDDQQVIW